MRNRLLAAFALFVCLVPACASAPDEAEETDATSDELRVAGYGANTLKYEGTCQFLRDCSSYSKKTPVGNVVWGCAESNTDKDGDGDLDYGACSDTSLWVAAPTRAYCNKTVHICKGTTCVDAKVKDVSVSKSWEASNGVFTRLDLDFGLSGKCSGFGSGRVTVTAR